MVTDNLRGILGHELTSEYTIEYKDTYDNVYKYHHDNIIGQDLDLDDHWSLVCGNWKFRICIYIFEFQPDKCIGFDKYTYETRPHSLKIYSYYRYTLSKESLDWYLYK